MSDETAIVVLLPHFLLMLMAMILTHGTEIPLIVEVTEGAVVDGGSITVRAPPEIIGGQVEIHHIGGTRFLTLHSLTVEIILTAVAPPQLAMGGLEEGGKAVGYPLDGPLELESMTSLLVIPTVLLLLALGLGVSLSPSSYNLLLVDKINVLLCIQ